MVSLYGRRLSVIYKTMPRAYFVFLTIEYKNGERKDGKYTSSENFPRSSKFLAFVFLHPRKEGKQYRS